MNVLLGILFTMWLPVVRCTYNGQSAEKVAKDLVPHVLERRPIRDKFY